MRWGIGFAAGLGWLWVGCGGDSVPMSAGETSTGAVPTPSASISTGAPGSESSTGGTSGSGASSSGDASSSSTGDPWDEPPECGSFDYAWSGLVEGPSEDGFDAALEGVAARHDRLHVGLASVPFGLAGDLTIALDNDTGREAIDAFLATEDAWDFEAATGVPVTDAVATWRKATGAFAGVAAAADAFRYGTLRDQGYACEAIEQARAQLLRAADGLHLATALTGEAGLVVRAIAHRDYAGDSESETTPLFDGNGDPLPPEKNNGTWREDNSGDHPDFVWEDSCSRDQLIGWAVGYGAMWEVIEHDPTIEQTVKDQLQLDAAAIARQLREVRPSGFDLEIWDPEGRPTFHGYLHEQNIEGTYLGLWNGFHAVMAAGIVGALAHVAGDAELDAYVYDELLTDRGLMAIAEISMLIDFGAATNYSNYNMGFDAIWLAGRYLDHDEARADLLAVSREMYASEDAPRQPVENAQSFFDFVHAATLSGASAFGSTPRPGDDGAVAQGLDTLTRFPVPPAYAYAVENCDADEIAAGTCTLGDGTVTELLAGVAHNDTLVAADPVPIDVRPPSNFYWRSNPYAVNGGSSGESLASSSDFRFAYWLARWTRRAPA